MPTIEEVIAQQKQAYLESLLRKLDKVDQWQDIFKKLDDEIAALERMLRLTRATSPNSPAVSKIIEEIERFKATRRAFLQQVEPQPETAPSVTQQGRGRTWQDIYITFLSDERVEVSIRDTRETHNYAEFGFEDRRSGKPRRAWVMLREMATKNGTIPRPTPGQPRAMTQKRIEEIREKLRARFGIEADPIPFNGATYQTRSYLINTFRPLSGCNLS